MTWLSKGVVTFPTGSDFASGLLLASGITGSDASKIYAWTSTGTSPTIYVFSVGAFTSGAATATRDSGRIFLSREGFVSWESATIDGTHIHFLGYESPFGTAYNRFLLNGGRVFYNSGNRSIAGRGVACYVGSNEGYTLDSLTAPTRLTAFTTSSQEYNPLGVNASKNITLSSGAGTVALTNPTLFTDGTYIWLAGINASNARQVQGWCYQISNGARVSSRDISYTDTADLARVTMTSGGDVYVFRRGSSASQVTNTARVLEFVTLSAGYTPTLGTALDGSGNALSTSNDGSTSAKPILSRSTFNVPVTWPSGSATDVVAGFTASDVTVTSSASSVVSAVVTSVTRQGTTDVWRALITVTEVAEAVTNSNRDVTLTVAVTAGALPQSSTRRASLAASQPYYYQATVNTAVPSWTTIPDQTARVGTAVSLDVSGNLSGIPTPTVMVSGNPSWLTLSGTTLSGTPTSVASAVAVTVTGRNVAGTASTTFDVTVLAALTTPSGSVSAQTVDAGTAFSLDLSTLITGNPAPTFQVRNTPQGANSLSGTGLTLSGTTLSGTPVRGNAGQHTIYLRAINSQGNHDFSFTFTVRVAPQWSTIADQTALRNALNTLDLLPYVSAYPTPTFTKLSGASWWTISGTRLQGRPLSTARIETVRVRASNALGEVETTFRVTVVATLTLSAPLGSVPNQTGTTSTAFTLNLSSHITGFPTPTFTERSIPAGSGLSLSGTTLSGTPTAVGEYTIQMTATNSQGSHNFQFTFTVTALPVAPTGSVPNQRVAQNAPFSLDLSTFFSATPPPTFSVESGQTIPAGSGLSLSGTTLSGTPTTVGVYTIRLTVTNSQGSQNFQFTFTVIGVVSVIPTGSVPNQTGYYPVDFSLELLAYVVGTPVPTFSVQTGHSIPPFSGLALSGTTLSGTPSRAGVYTIRLTATNSAGTFNFHFDFLVEEVAAPTALAPIPAQHWKAGYFNPVDLRQYFTGRPFPTFRIGGNANIASDRSGVGYSVPMNISNVGQAHLTASNVAGSVTATFIIRTTDPVPATGSVPDQTGSAGVPFSLDLSEYISGDYIFFDTQANYRLPEASGLALGNDSFDSPMLSGTPTAGGTYTIALLAYYMGRSYVRIGSPSGATRDASDFNIDEARAFYFHFTFTVTAPTVATSVSAIDDMTAYVGKIFRLELAPYVTGYPIPTLSLSGNPPWLSLSGTVLSGTPTLTAGEVDVTITARSASGTDSVTFGITVKEQLSDIAPSGQVPLQVYEENSDTSLMLSDYILGNPDTIRLMRLPASTGRRGEIPSVSAYNRPRDEIVLSTPTQTIYNIDQTLFFIAWNDYGTHIFPFRTRPSLPPRLNTTSSGAPERAFDVRIHFLWGYTLFASTSSPILSFPRATITMTGAPAWLSLTDTKVTEGDGTYTTGTNAITVAGTPNTPINTVSTVRFTATNAYGSVSQTLTLTVVPGPLGIYPSRLPERFEVQFGSAFRVNLAEYIFGNPSPTFELNDSLGVLRWDPGTGRAILDPLGSVPRTLSAIGLQLVGTVISGTPTMIGFWEINIRANILVGADDPRLISGLRRFLDESFVLVVREAPVWGDIAPQTATENHEFSLDLSDFVEGVPVPTISVRTSPTVTQLPDWLTLEDATLSGTPTEAAGAVLIQLTATNTGGVSHTSFSLTVQTETEAPTGTVPAQTAYTGLAFSLDLSEFITSRPPSTFSATTTLPDWLTLEGTTLSGTPTEAAAEITLNLQASSSLQHPTVLVGTLDFTVALTVLQSVAPSAPQTLISVVQFNVGEAFVFDVLPYFVLGTPLGDITLMTGTELPDWITLESDDLIGTYPTTSDLSTEPILDVPITVTNHEGSVTVTFHFVFQLPLTPLWIRRELPRVSSGFPYQVDIASYVRGTPTPTISVTSGETLPAGLSLFGTELSAEALPSVAMDTTYAVPLTATNIVEGVQSETDVSLVLVVGPSTNAPLAYEAELILRDLNRVPRGVTRNPLLYFDLTVIRERVTPGTRPRAERTTGGIYVTVRNYYYTRSNSQEGIYRYSFDGTLLDRLLFDAPLSVEASHDSWEFGGGVSPAPYGIADDGENLYVIVGLYRRGLLRPIAVSSTGRVTYSLPRDRITHRIRKIPVSDFPSNVLPFTSGDGTSGDPSIAPGDPTFDEFSGFFQIGFQGTTFVNRGVSGGWTEGYVHVFYADGKVYFSAYEPTSHPPQSEGPGGIIGSRVNYFGQTIGGVRVGAGGSAFSPGWDVWFDDGRRDQRSDFSLLARPLERIRYLYPASEFIVDARTGRQINPIAVTRGNVLVFAGCWDAVEGNLVDANVRDGTFDRYLLTGHPLDERISFGPLLGAIDWQEEGSFAFTIDGLGEYDGDLYAIIGRVVTSQSTSGVTGIANNAVLKQSMVVFKRISAYWSRPLPDMEVSADNNWETTLDLTDYAHDDSVFAFVPGWTPPTGLTLTGSMLRYAPPSGPDRLLQYSVYLQATLNDETVYAKLSATGMLIAPVWFTLIPVQEAVAGVLFSLDVTDFIASGSPTPTITFVEDSFRPTWLALVNNTLTGVPAIRAYPRETRYNIELTAENSHGTADKTLMLRVVPAPSGNLPPTWTAIPTQQLSAGSPFTLDLSNYLQGSPTPMVANPSPSWLDVTGLVLSGTPSTTEFPEETDLRVTLSATNVAGTADTVADLNIRPRGSFVFVEQVPTTTIAPPLQYRADTITATAQYIYVASVNRVPGSAGAMLVYNWSGARQTSLEFHLPTIDDATSQGYAGMERVGERLYLLEQKTETDAIGVVHNYSLTGEAGEGFKISDMTSAPSDVAEEALSNYVFRRQAQPRTLAYRNEEFWVGTRVTNSNNWRMLPLDDEGVQGIVEREVILPQAVDIKGVAASPRYYYVLGGSAQGDGIGRYTSTFTYQPGFDIDLHDDNENPIGIGYGDGRLVVLDNTNGLFIYAAPMAIEAEPLPVSPIPPSLPIPENPSTPTVIAPVVPPGAEPQPPALDFHGYRQFEGMERWVSYVDIVRRDTTNRFEVLALGVEIVVQSAISPRQLTLPPGLVIADATVLPGRVPYQSARELQARTLLEEVNIVPRYAVSGLRIDDRIYVFTGQRSATNPQAVGQYWIVTAITESGDGRHQEILAKFSSAEDPA